MTTRAINVNLPAELHRLAGWLRRLPDYRQSAILAHFGINNLSGLPAHKLTAAYRMIRSEVEQRAAEIEAEDVDGVHVESGNVRFVRAESPEQMLRDPHGVLVTLEEETARIDGASLSRAIGNLLRPYLENILAKAQAIINRSEP